MRIGGTHDTGYSVLPCGQEPSQPKRQDCNISKLFIWSMKHWSVNEWSFYGKYFLQGLIAVLAP